MKMKDAQKIINGKKPGFRVHFGRITGNFVETDYFPGKKEPLINIEDFAWTMAEEFAKNTVGKCIDIYVVDEDYNPIGSIVLNPNSDRENKKPQIPGEK